VFWSSEGFLNLMVLQIYLYDVFDFIVAVLMLLLFKKFSTEAKKQKLEHINDCSEIFMHHNPSSENRTEDSQSLQTMTNKSRVQTDNGVPAFRLSSSFSKSQLIHNQKLIDSHRENNSQAVMPSPNFLNNRHSLLQEDLLSSNESLFEKDNTTIEGVSKISKFSVIETQKQNQNPLLRHIL